MSLDIDKIILHSLRQGGDGQPHADTRSQTLPADEAVQGLMAELHRIYNGKGGKGFGFFADPETAVAELAEGEMAPKQPSPAFRIALEQLLGEQSEFVPFSVNMTHLLVKNLVEHALDEQGVLLFAKYNYVGVDYLMIALLEGKESVTVSEALDLRHIHYLDIGKLNLVARIDLTEWKTQADSRRYITFSKGRVGRKLGDFFMDLLGAREGMDAKIQNKELLQAVDDYCDSRQLEAAERNDYEIAIPKLGSLVLTHSLDGEIQPLTAVPREERPPVAPVFYAFRVMVGIGTAMLLLVLASLWAWRRGTLERSRWLLQGWRLMLPSGFIALLAGWYVVEIGRQPYVIYGLLRTADAVSAVDAGSVLTSLVAFVVAYAGVFGAGTWYLFKLVRKGPQPHEPAPDTEHGEKTPARPLSLPDEPGEGRPHDSAAATGGAA